MNVSVSASYIGADSCLATLHNFAGLLPVLPPSLHPSFASSVLPAALTKSPRTLPGVRTCVYA